MGKLQIFEVLLAGNKEVYKPGDVIQGEARIVVSEEKRDIRGIQIKCVGKAYTHWTESEGSGDNRRSVSYYTRYEYFKQEVLLRGAAFQHTLRDPYQNPYAVQPIPGQSTPGQSGYPPQGQQGYPSPGQPGVPPQWQPGYPPQGQQGYHLGQPGMPPPDSNQAGYPATAGYPLPGESSNEEGLPPPPTYKAAVGGPQKGKKGKKGFFRNTVYVGVYAPQYPFYDPETLYAAMGIPLAASTSSGGGQPAPTVMQPMSIQQPPHQS